MARLKERYQTELLPTLATQLGTPNPHQAPRIVKIVVAVGVGRATQDSSLLERASGHLAAITGQHPLTTRARKSIAGFKLREGMPVGLKVTLRGERMYEFLDRLIETALPRVRDFRGLSPDAFDPDGNYSIGLGEIAIFPELADIEVGAIHGVQITIVTSTQDREAGEALMRAFGLPLRKRGQDG